MVRVLVEYKRERSSYLEISMIGRDAHITSNLLMNYCVAISYVSSSVPLSTNLFERERICETMNPGPILIIRNNFPTTIIHFLFAAIYKFENTKILYFLHSQYKTQKHHLSLLSPSLHIIIAYLFLVCIKYYFYIILTPCT